MAIYREHIFKPLIVAVNVINKIRTFFLYHLDSHSLSFWFHIFRRLGITTHPASPGSAKHRLKAVTHIHQLGGYQASATTWILDTGLPRKKPYLQQIS